jgi:hypothetical protein
MKHRTFLPPADITDADEGFRKIWHEQMTQWFRSAIRALELGDPSDRLDAVGAGRSQFYSPAELPDAVSERTVPIVWSGFPRTLTTLYGRDLALVAAENLAYFGTPDPTNPPGTMTTAFSSRAFVETKTSRPLRVAYRMQDEYLEWRAERNEAGLITKVTFTCEGPEYWEALARYDRKKLVQLYRTFVDPCVRIDELCWSTDAKSGSVATSYKAGDYNPNNEWNTARGIMHLSHPANNLGAEISLAAQATILRKGSGSKYLTEPIRLTCGADFGDPNRSSDPQIGSYANALARAGAKVSLEIPVGLYIAGFNWNCVTFEDGRPAPNSYWRVLRGDPGDSNDPDRPSRILRLEYAVPYNERYTVGDLYVDGERIEYGGQLAMNVRMKLVASYYGNAYANEPKVCRNAAYRLESAPDYLWSFPKGGGAAGFVRAFPSDASFR